MRVRAAVVAVGMVAGVLCCGGSASGAIVLANMPRVPVLSGDGALWAEPAGSGGFVVRSGREGGAPVDVHTFLPEKADQYLVPTLAASASTAVVATKAFEVDPGSPPPSPVLTPYAEQFVGALAGPFGRVSRCPGDRVVLRSVDVSGDAYARRECDSGRGHVEIADRGAMPLSPARSVGTGGYGARIAGRYVAWLDGSYEGLPDDVDSDIVVYDRVAGAEVYRVPHAELPGVVRSLDVQDDGKVAFAFAAVRAGEQQVVGWASPAEPHVHRLPLAPSQNYDVHIAADRIAFERGRDSRGDFAIQDAEVGLSDLAGHTQIVARHADDYPSQESFDYDGQHLLWRQLGCEHPELVIAAVDAQPSPGGALHCPLKLLRPPTYRHGTVSFRFDRGAFEPPCTFDVWLRTPGAHGRAVGTNVPGRGSTNPVNIELTRAARLTLARRGRIRLAVKVRLSDANFRQQIRHTTVTVRR